MVYVRQFLYIFTENRIINFKNVFKYLRTQVQVTRLSYMQTEADDVFV